MSNEELGSEKVKVFFNGDEFIISALANEDQVREAVSEKFPEALNAKITKDETTGNWTVTREAGQKGA